MPTPLYHERGGMSSVAFRASGLARARHRQRFPPREQRPSCDALPVVCPPQAMTLPSLPHATDARRQYGTDL